MVDAASESPLVYDLMMLLDEEENGLALDALEDAVLEDSVLE